MIIIVLFRPLMLCLSKISLLLHIFRFITDEPEIDVEAEKVHSGVGKEAHLTCIVHGEPRPSVSTAAHRYILEISPWAGQSVIWQCKLFSGFHHWDSCFWHLYTDWFQIFPSVFQKYFCSHPLRIQTAGSKSKREYDYDNHNELYFNTQNTKLYVGNQDFYTSSRKSNLNFNFLGIRKSTRIILKIRQNSV